MFTTLHVQAKRYPLQVNTSDSYLHITCNHYLNTNLVFPFILLMAVTWYVTCVLPLTDNATIPITQIN